MMSANGSDKRQITQDEAWISMQPGDLNLDGMNAGLPIQIHF
jgi:hypothetical protein